MAMITAHKGLAGAETIWNIRNRVVLGLLTVGRLQICIIPVYSKLFQGEEVDK